MSFAIAATKLPSLWTGLLRQWAQERPTHTGDVDESLTRAEAIAHLKTLIRQYERSQPSYADDLRSALAQLDGESAAR